MSQIFSKRTLKYSASAKLSRQQERLLLMMHLKAESVEAEHNDFSSKNRGRGMAVASQVASNSLRYPSDRRGHFEPYASTSRLYDSDRSNVTYFVLCITFNNFPVQLGFQSKP